MSSVAGVLTRGRGVDVFGIERQRPGFQMSDRGLALISLAAIVIVGVATALGPIAGVMAVAAVALGLIVLSRPAFGALLLVGFVPAVSGFGRGYPIPGLRVSEVLVAGIASAVILTADRRRIPCWGLVDWSLLAYVIATAGMGYGDILARGDSVGLDAVGTLLGPLQYLLLFRAARIALDTPSRRRAALRFVLLASVPVAVIGILQQLDLPGLRSWLATATQSNLAVDWSYQQLPRATSIFPHWHVLGGYMLVVILLAVSLLLERDQRVMSRRGLIGVLVLGSAALIWTVTIAPMIAAAVGTVAIAILRRRVDALRWLALAGVLAAVLFGPILVARYDQQRTQDSAVPQTVAYRFNVWADQYLPALSGRWLTGYGPQLPPDVTWRYTESMYVELLMKGGLVLLLAYAWLMLALFSRATAVVREGDREQQTVGRLLAVLIAMLTLMHLIVPYLTNVGVTHLFFGLAGLMLAKSTSRRRIELED